MRHRDPDEEQGQRSISNYEHDGKRSLSGNDSNSRIRACIRWRRTVSHSVGPGRQASRCQAKRTVHMYRHRKSSTTSEHFCCITFASFARCCLMFSTFTAQLRPLSLPLPTPGQGCGFQQRSFLPNNLTCSKHRLSVCHRQPEHAQPYSA